MSKFILVIGLLIHAKTILFSQVYIKEGKNRYSFAQSTIGYDFEYSPSTGYSYQRNGGNLLEKIPIGNSISPVISITGLHFWGHAEFFTGFSLGNISTLKKEGDHVFKRSGATGGKFFPWQIRTNRLCPYIGASISTFSYKQGQGALYKRVDYPILVGLSYSFKRGLLEAGCNYHYANNYDYYISKTESVPLNIPKLSFTIDFKYFFDFSMQSYHKEKSGDLDNSFNMLKRRKKLSSVILAVGPAYSFFTGNSSYNKSVHPYLDDHQVSKIFPDIGLGYYNYKADLCFNVAWRSFQSKINAYGLAQEVKRNSIALEMYKFLGDYHGFVPFVGGAISYERFHVNEYDNGNLNLTYTKTMASPGILVGWDIRPTRVDWWGIRTNIRYFPFLKLEVQKDAKIDFQQIELNFLQLVIYPNRMYAYLKKQ